MSLRWCVFFSGMTMAEARGIWRCSFSDMFAEQAIQHAKVSTNAKKT